MLLFKLLAVGHRQISGFTSVKIRLFCTLPSLAVLPINRLIRLLFSIPFLVLPSLRSFLSSSFPYKIKNIKTTNPFFIYHMQPHAALISYYCSKSYSLYSVRSLENSWFGLPGGLRPPAELLSGYLFVPLRSRFNMEKHQENVINVKYIPLLIIVFVYLVYI